MLMEQTWHSPQLQTALSLNPCSNGMLMEPIMDAEKFDAKKS